MEKLVLLLRPVFRHGMKLVGLIQDSLVNGDQVTVFLSKLYGLNHG
jgi:hypothetical protein